MTVYLIHFNQPYRHARHYIGYTASMNSLSSRLTCHACGEGARLMQVIHKAGITWKVAKVWEKGDRTLEKRLKGWHGAGQFCPICKKEGIL